MISAEAAWEVKRTMGLVGRHVPSYQVSCGEAHRTTTTTKAETTAVTITIGNGSPSGYKMPSSSSSSNPDTSSSSDFPSDIVLIFICEFQDADF